MLIDLFPRDGVLVRDADIQGFRPEEEPALLGKYFGDHNYD
jgi:hypothetical protein